MRRSNEVAVLDIGSGKLRVVIAEKNGASNTLIKGIGEVEYSGFSNGRWLEPKGVRGCIATAVKNAEASSGTKIKRIFVGVPSEFTYLVCKEAQLFFQKSRKVSENEIEKLLEISDRFEDDALFKTINISPIYYLLANNKRIVDPRGVASDQLKALLSYIRSPKDFLSFIDGAFEGTGIAVEYMSSILAESMYLFEQEQRQKFVLFADIGYITTSLTLIRGNGLLHLYAPSCGGGYVTADIADGHGYSFLEAEAIKRKLNLAYYNGDSGKINNTVCETLSKLAAYIAEGLKNSIYDCPKHLSLYITGGGISYINGAKEFLAELLDRNVEIIAPNMPGYGKPEYSSAIGLAAAAFGLIDKK